MSTEPTPAGPNRWVRQLTDEEQQDHLHLLWVNALWNEMRTTKVGMTRGELLKVWQPQGGLSWKTYQSFQSRRCRMFLLDAKFEPYVGPDAQSGFDYDDRDIITHLSPIMVGLPAMD